MMESVTEWNNQRHFLIFKLFSSKSTTKKGSILIKKKIKKKTKTLAETQKKKKIHTVMTDCSRTASSLITAVYVLWLNTGVLSLISVTFTFTVATSLNEGVPPSVASTVR